jgi:hypothetical protein
MQRMEKGISCAKRKLGEDRLDVGTESYQS